MVRVRQVFQYLYCFYLKDKHTVDSPDNTSTIINVKQSREKGKNKDKVVCDNISRQLSIIFTEDE